MARGNRQRSPRPDRQERAGESARAADQWARVESAPSLVQPAPTLIPLDVLVGCYITMIVLGFVVLRVRGVMPAGNELNVDRTVFTVVNAATLSGFQMNVSTGQFDSGHIAGPVVVLLLTIGGTFFTLVTGGLAAVRALRLKFSDWDVIAGAMTAMTVTTFCGAAVLLGPDRGLGDALLQAASAFGNSGLYTGALPGLNDWRTYFVLLPLATLGGLGMPVLMELYQLAVWWAERLFDKSLTKSRDGETAEDERDKGRRPNLSEHTRTVLKVTAILYLGGFLLLMLTRDEFWENLLPGMSHGGPAQGAAVRYALLSSSAAAINSRSTGFPLEYTDLLPRASQWVLMLLMVIGASPAGTGGGIKGTTVVQLVRGVRDALAGRRVPRAFGIAAVWVTGYALIVFFGFVLLLWQVPQMTPDRLLILSVSAASNVGLSPDSISLVMGPLYTMSLMMVLGRLAPLAVLWWLARDGGETELLVG